MPLPNFIILGAAKAGTTALYHYLKQHPEVGMSRVKETNYLALKGHPLDFRGPGDAEYIRPHAVTTELGYHDQFAHCDGKKAIGEASPLYLYDPKVPGEIQQLLPDAKLVAILRHPVDRAYSAFLHLIRDRRETTDDFLEALRREPERIADHWEHIWHYVAMGRYAEQLDRYLARFPRDQIRIYIYRELRKDPRGLLRDLYTFLDIDPTFEADISTRHNAGLPSHERPPLLPEARAWIADALAADVARLGQIVGMDLSHWAAA